jgi:hypothetical protein
MFYFVPNLSTVAVQELETPWLVDSPRPDFGSKDEYRLWCSAPTTSHVFFTAIQGQHPGIRVSQDNPPARMSGLVLDYDAIPSSPPEQMLLANAPEGLRPAWVSRTFSGNCRVVFLFEEAVPLFSPELAKEFLKKVARELKLRKLLPGFESEALLDLGKTYELGTDWTPVGDPEAPCLIPANLLLAWLSDVSKKHKWADEGVSIPVETLRAEGAKRFPDRWPGGWDAFEIGSRGPRFWDETSSDPTAMVVRETGCQFYSDGGGWMTWEAIFGSDFIRRWANDRKGKAIKDVWFDGKFYWKRDIEGRWNWSNKDDLRQDLAVYDRLLSRSAKANTPSEVDEAVCDIRHLHRVQKAMPFLYRPDGPINYNGKRYLNTSTLRPILPVDQAVEWGEGFPWLAQFLFTLFEPDDQLDYFMAWLKHFYLGAYSQDPRRGLALFIAGPVGAGKTVLNKAIIGQLMGGRQDAERFLLGKDPYNDALFGAAVWNIDDGVDSGDPRMRAVFTQVLKKIVANDNFTYRAMYTGGEDMEWVGRPIITLNDDAESLRMLPETDRNILDKIMLLKTKSPDVDRWPTDREIAQELPYFAAFLRDWEAPEHTKPAAGKGRFGVVTYRHPDLMQAASSTDVTSSFEELLELWRTEWFAAGGPGEGAQSWTGSPTGLFSAIGMNDRLKQVLDKNFPHTTAIGTHLNKLIRRMGAGSYITKTGHRTYIIVRPVAA